MSSFGDFAALSEEVDVPTAKFLKGVIRYRSVYCTYSLYICMTNAKLCLYCPVCSDGIIAPGYTEEALAILTTKQTGNFIVLKANAVTAMPDIEYRELHGMVLAQKRNTVIFTKEHLPVQGGVCDQGDTHPGRARHDPRFHRPQVHAE